MSASKKCHTYHIIKECKTECNLPQKEFISSYKKFFSAEANVENTFGISSVSSGIRSSRSNREKLWSKDTSSGSIGNAVHRAARGECST